MEEKAKNSVVWLQAMLVFGNDLARMAENDDREMESLKIKLKVNDAKSKVMVCDIKIQGE